MLTRNRKQAIPFVFYTAMALISGAAATISERRSLASILLLLLAGFVSWELIEYGMHRLILHHVVRLKRFPQLHRNHLAHHQHPQAADDLFISLWMSLPIASGYCLLAWALIGSWQVAAYLFIGLVIGYFGYEWLHYQAHHSRPSLRPLRYLKKYHLLHHHQTPSKRFGVSSPLMDCLFGTFLSVGHQRRI